jgi:hypothetical protein
MLGRAARLSLRRALLRPPRHGAAAEGRRRAHAAAPPRSPDAAAAQAKAQQAKQAQQAQQAQHQQHQQHRQQPPWQQHREEEQQGRQKRVVLHEEELRRIDEAHDWRGDMSKRKLSSGVDGAEGEAGDVGAEDAEGAEESVQSGERRARKKTKPARNVTFVEFNALQKASDAAGFLVWYGLNRGAVLADKKLHAGAVRLLSEAGAVTECEELLARAESAGSSLANSFANEPMFTNVVRMYAARGEVFKALGVRDKMRALRVDARLRTFRALLAAHAEHGAAQPGFQERHRALYDDMVSTLAAHVPRVFPDEEAYESTLAGFSRAAALAAAAGDVAARDSALAAFDRVLAESAGDVALPGAKLLSLVRARFALEPERWEVTEGCSVDAATSACSHCARKLRSVELSAEAAARLRAQVESLRLQAGTAGSGNATHKNNAARIDAAWRDLQAYLDEAKATGRGVDYVVDGANVAHARDGRFSYSTLGWMLAELDARGLSWIVFVHESRGHLNSFTARDNHVLRLLSRDRRHFVVPHGANDDWFWLYAAVYLGGRTKVLSNDHMRDHHFSMLSTRDFQFWRERHQAFFKFWNGRESMDSPPASLQLLPPSDFSKRTQSDLVAGRQAWHLPSLLPDALQEPQQPVPEHVDIVTPQLDSLTWACVRPR